MKTHLFIICVLVCGLMSACTVVTRDTVRGSGKIISEDRTLSGVKAVALALPGDLVIELGDRESLQVEVEDNLMPYIESNVVLGVLTIESRRNISILPIRAMRYHLVVKSLERIEDSSLGSITAPALKATSFTIKISSAGSVRLAGLEADSLNAQLSSIGNLEIGGGQVGRQNVTISSAGSYRAGDVRSQSATLKLSSMGSATVWVTDSLDATLSSAGSVNYYGTPRITQHTSSIGSLKSLGEK